MIQDWVVEYAQVTSHQISIRHGDHEVLEAKKIPLGWALDQTIHGGDTDIDTLRAQLAALIEKIEAEEGARPTLWISARHARVLIRQVGDAMDGDPSPIDRDIAQELMAAVSRRRARGLDDSVRFLLEIAAGNLSQGPADALRSWDPLIDAVRELGYQVTGSVRDRSPLRDDAGVRLRLEPGQPRELQEIISSGGWTLRLPNALSR